MTVADRPSEEVLALVHLAAGRLNERRPELTVEMTQLLARIDQLDGDPRMVSLLEASVGANIETIMHVLINDIPISNLQPTTAAVEYAERLAQRGVPANSLVRAYHMGQEELIASCFAEVQALDCDPELRLHVLRHISSTVYRYIDWISLYVLEMYESEQQRWNTTTGHVRTTMLHAILRGEPVDLDAFQAETRHVLNQHHIGLVVWGEEDVDVLRELEQAVRRLAGAAEPLFSAVDRSTAWAWLPRGRSAMPLTPDEVGKVLADLPAAGAAIGLPGMGLEGFRRTHAQAQAARAVAAASGGGRQRAVSYGDDGIAAIAMLTRDMEALRSWVQEVLGDLATDDRAHADLRETLRVFYACGGHHGAAAEALSVHRNTLKYRLEKIRRVLGRSHESGRLDIELALQACHYLGSSVL